MNTHYFFRIDLRTKNTYPSENYVQYTTVDFLNKKRNSILCWLKYKKLKLLFLKDKLCFVKKQKTKTIK